MDMEQKTRTLLCIHDIIRGDCPQCKVNKLIMETLHALQENIHKHNKKIATIDELITKLGKELLK